MFFMGFFFISSWNRRFYKFGLMPMGTTILFPLPLPLRMLFKKGKLSSINMFFKTSDLKKIIKTYNHLILKRKKIKKILVDKNL